MKFHPAAEIFPLLEGNEFIKLCSDIRENGLRLPIVQHPDGSILDGRNRYRACEEMRIRPLMVRWEGKPGTEVAYVLSLNLARRHLNESQRAMVAAKLATLRDGQRKSPASIEAPAQGEAAKTLHVGRSSVQRARVVLDAGTPEQIRAVERGETTVSKTVNAIQGKTKPARKPKPKAAPSSELTALRAEAENLKEWGEGNAQNAKELLAENESMRKVFDADDKLKAAMAEIKRLTGINAILSSRINGLQNETSELVKIIKSRDYRIKKLEAEAKK